MPSHIRVFVHVIDENGSPKKSMHLTVQSYDIRKKGFQTLANVRTDNNGKVDQKIQLKLRQPEVLRIINRLQRDEIIAEGATIGLEENGAVYAYDFGLLEYLGDESYEIKGSLPGTKSKKRKIAALPHKKELKMAEAMRFNMQFMKLKQAGGQGTNAAASTREAEAAGASKINSDTMLKHKDDLIALSQVERTKATMELLNTQQILSKTKLELNDHIQQITSLQSKVQTAEKARLKAERDAQKKLEAEAKRREALQKQLDTQVDISALQQTLASSLGQAAAPNRKSGFKMGRVQVSLKAMIAGGGSRVTLADAETLKDAVSASALSDIHVEYIPDDDGAPNEDTQNGVTIPDVSGLTESAAGRILTSMGLNLQAVSGRTDDKRIATGQAFRQAPEPGDTISKGGAVMVVFATPFDDQ